MCYNCGCGLPDDPMGQGHAGAEPNGKSVTTKTWDEAAKSQNMTRKEAMQNALQLLQSELQKEP